MGHRDLAPTAFAHWLDAELRRRGIGVRTLARRISETSVPPRTLEGVRRSLNKYILDGNLPGEKARQEIAAALDVPTEDMPNEDDEELARSVAESAVDRYKLSLLEKVL